jgi:hypothetical protein
MLKILTQAPTAIDPGNRTLDHPASRQHLETDLVSWARDNRDCDAKQSGDR